MEVALKSYKDFSEIDFLQEFLALSVARNLRLLDGCRVHDDGQVEFVLCLPGGAGEPC